MESKSGLGWRIVHPRFTPKGLHPNGGKTAIRKSIPTWQSQKKKTRGVIDKHPRTLNLASSIGLVNNAAHSPSRNTASNCCESRL